jgi:hypothetical protein
MLARNRVTKRYLYALRSHGVGEELAACRHLTYGVGEFNVEILSPISDLRHYRHNH